MKKLLLTSVLITTIGLTGCSTNTQGQNTVLGGVTGAAAGGLVGSAFGGGGAIAAGAVVGALVGGVIGHSMDNSDNMHTTGAMNGATSNTTTWTNSKTGITYTMTPTSNFFTYKGNNKCRKFHFTATQHAKKKSFNGIACQKSDGSWYTVHRH